MLYGDDHRTLQGTFETRKLADVMQRNVHVALTEAEASFIASRDMMFLSSVDHRGQPTVSYKGGDPGFVRVVDPSTLAFPSYDGNGMYLSLGNIRGNARVGLLFIDFEKPRRLRVHGEATLCLDDPLLDAYKEADLIVRVNVTEIFPNCPRYIHSYEKIAPSSYVPRPSCSTPVPDWKRLDDVQDALRPRDRGKAEEPGGTMTRADYEASRWRK